MEMQAIADLYRNGFLLVSNSLRENYLIDMHDKDNVIIADSSSNGYSWDKLRQRAYATRRGDGRHKEAYK